METVDEDPQFTDWMDAVNADLNQAGIDAREMGGLPYHQWYEQGMSPAAAAQHVLQATESGSEMLLLDELDDLDEQ